ncbi:hypothetical protein MG293_012442 [Ovis ammon polii]|uniref:Caveolae associated protein 3 n=1 Tax=Ovis ammon polii TaxID=230172 RepID=A0AAD4Y7F6_OVIAM|nr:hypothetical protein MG293_012442 [Ovis ammon polii]
MGESALESGPVPGAPAGGPVHAVTVVTLLEKLATMLETLRERQGGLAQRQGGLAGSVRRIQSNLGALSRSHDTTSNTLAQLLAKAERVGSHADAAQERAVRRAAQVQRLEANHGLLVARGKLHVLLFKEEAEIPAKAFQKAPEPLGPVELGPQQPEAEAEESSDEEEPVESRARRLRRTGLEKPFCRSRFLCVAQVLNGFSRFLCVVQVASSKLAGAPRLHIESHLERSVPVQVGSLHLPFLAHVQC